MDLMNDEAKPKSEMPMEKEGDYSEHDLECMLEAFITAKKIEKDPSKYKMLKDYAMSKNKMVSQLFDDTPKMPKSFKEVKAMASKKLEEQDKEETEEY